MNIVIIGSGNVAQAIATALHEKGENIVQIVARSQSGADLAKSIGCEYTDQFSNPAKADLYIISVSDSAIELVSEKLNISPNAVVVHTAGAIEANVLSKHKHFGVLYPLQTFTKGRHVDFNQIPVFIDGNDAYAIDVIRQVADVLSPKVRKMNFEQRSQVHLAAVFACNFTNHMYVIAESLLKNHDIEFDILKPLIKETAEKAIEAESPVTTQTGPAIRNDFKTKNKHCELLDNTILRTLYTNLSNHIWETSKKI